MPRRHEFPVGRTFLPASGRCIRRPDSATHRPPSTLSDGGQECPPHQMRTQFRSRCSINEDMNIDTVPQVPEEELTRIQAAMHRHAESHVPADPDKELNIVA